MKILSVVIPFYNSVDTLEKAAMSCLDPRIIDDIEVVMVNDGSKDDSLKLAKDIEKRYPNSVKVIDKPNGGKGSCMNAGIKVASGKYVRELDSDDYFNDGSICELISEVKHNNIDVDVIYTNFLFVYLASATEKVNRNTEIVYGKVINLNRIQLPSLIYQNYQMHSLTYKTEFLHNINFIQTEGISYTDTEYIYYPLTVANSLYAIDLELYCYCIGVAGQSISPQSMQKKWNHFWILSEKFMKDSAYKTGNTSALQIRRNVVGSVIRSVVEIYAEMSQYNSDQEKKIRGMLNEVKKTDAELFKSAMYLERRRFMYPLMMWYYLGRGHFVIRSLKTAVRKAL